MLIAFIVLAIVGGIFLYMIGPKNRAVRCPNCTQLRSIPESTKDYNCVACGNPVLKDGQFVSSQKLST